jgi:hypothetical protein
MAFTEFNYGPDTFTNTPTWELRDLVKTGLTNAADLNELALLKAARAEIERRTQWIKGFQ